MEAHPGGSSNMLLSLRAIFGSSSPMGPDSTPIPIPRLQKTAAVLTNLVLGIVQIVIATRALRIFDRHRDGDDDQLWDSFPNDFCFRQAIICSVVMILTFGINGLSEIHPRQWFYSRRGICLSSGFIMVGSISYNAGLLVQAYELLSIRQQGSQDTFKVGMLCVGAIALGFLQQCTVAVYMNLFWGAVQQEAKLRNITDGASNGADDREGGIF